MKKLQFDVLGYNFPHWKTSQGIDLLLSEGYCPANIILQNKKVLNIPTSKTRLTPQFEAIEPVKADAIVCDHDSNEWQTKSDFAVILGARILKQHTIDRYPLGIVNIHPGYLPGNRGLDNLKWAIVHKLPIGATAHFIDSKIDMGRKIAFCRANIKRGTNLFNVYQKLRDAELAALLVAMSLIMESGLKPNECPAIEYTPKYSALPDYLDEHLADYWTAYKESKLINTRALMPA